MKDFQLFMAGFVHIKRTILLLGLILVIVTGAFVSTVEVHAQKLFLNEKGEQTKIEFDFGGENIPQELQDALVKYANGITGTKIHSIKLTLSNYYRNGDWTFVSFIDVEENKLKWRTDDAFPPSMLFIGVLHGNTWNVGFAGSKEFSDLLADAPEEFIPVHSKPVVDPLRNDNIPKNVPPLQAETYKLPWDSSQNSWFKVGKTPGFHSGTALDFQPTFHGDVSRAAWALSMSNGTVVNVARCTTTGYVQVSNGDGMSQYLHLSRDTIDPAIQIGQPVVPGQYMGDLYYPPGDDSFDDGACGSGFGRHLHVAFPSKSIIVDGNSATYYSNLPFATLVNSSNHMVIGDITPPTTSIALSGTTGENGWYRSTVQITLSAVDNSGGSGVGQTQYKIGSGSWQTYSTPFPVSTDGAHTVYYKSVDVAGNPETEKFTPINIDSVAPTGSLVVQNGSAETYSTIVELNTQAGDSTSGIAAVRFRDGGQVTWSSWYAPGSTLWQLIGSSGQTVSVEAQFKDNAGNVSVVYSESLAINLYPARPSSSLYILQNSTFGAAGMHVDSSQYGMNGTAGQPTIIGYMESSNYKMNSGFWAVTKTQPGPTPPYVISVIRVNFNPTNLASVDFTVTFSESVTGVDTSDFSLTTTGDISGASVTAVTGGPRIYTVTVNTGSGDGTLRLDLNASGTDIQDLTGNPISGGFTKGQAYTVVSVYNLFLPLILR